MISTAESTDHFNTVPVYFSATEEVPPVTWEKLRDKLRTVLPDTGIEYCGPEDVRPSWFKITTLPIGKIDEFALLLRIDENETDFTKLVADIRKYIANETIARFTWRKFSGLFVELIEEDQSLAWQLASIQRFNFHICTFKAEINDFYQAALSWQSVTQENLLEIGRAADAHATNMQTRWQRLVIATTKDVAEQGSNGSSYRWNFFKLLFGPNLLCLGMLAAISFAAFTELSGGCNEHDWMSFVQCGTSVWTTYAAGIFILVYILSLGVAWYLYAKAKVERWEVTHQDYRLLSECLRVQYFWLGVGINECVTSNEPTTKQGEWDWVQNALRALHYQCKGDDSANNSGPEQAKIWREIGEKFIDAQFVYHEKTLLIRRKRAVNRLSSWSRHGLGIFLVMVTTLIAITGLELFLKHSHIVSPMTHHFIVIFCLASLIFWGSVRRAMDNFGWEAEYRRGEVVQSALQHAQLHWNDPVQRLEVLRRVGKAFVADQMAWHKIHRERRLEAVSGA